MKPIAVYRALFLMVAPLISPPLPADVASNDFKCDKSKASIKIPNAALLLVSCATHWPDLAQHPAYLEIWELHSDKRRSPINITGASRFVDSDEDVLRVAVAPDLKGSRNYLLVLKKAPDQDPPDAMMEFSTAPTATIMPSLAAAARGRKFVVKSNVGIDQANQQKLVEKRGKAAMEIEHSATVDISAKPPGKPEITDDPDVIGVAPVALSGGRSLQQAKAIVRVDGLVDKFGQPLKDETAVDISAPPKGKDDSTQYYQISHKAGPGAKPSLAVNVKTNSVLGWFGNRKFSGSFWVSNYLVQPEAVIDIGTLDYSRKSDDTIRLGVVSGKTWLNGNARSFWQGLRYGPGLTYESNLGFKKNLGLITYEVHPVLRGLYASREERRYAAAAARNVNSIDDIPQENYKAGAGLEFFVGLEAGGSFRDQVFMNKAKTASLPVDKYGAFRLRPRIHAFYEYDWLTIDWSGTLRYLFAEELAGEEWPDKTVHLRRLTGIQPYMEATIGFGLDRSKHTSLAVTYKRGAQPPAYQHTNVVQSGFVVKY